jgi:hypothetical protein
MEKNTVANRYESNAPGPERSDRIEHALQDAAERVHSIATFVQLAQDTQQGHVHVRLRVCVCLCVCVCVCVCVTMSLCCGVSAWV